MANKLAPEQQRRKDAGHAWIFKRRKDGTRYKWYLSIPPNGDLFQAKELAEAEGEPPDEAIVARDQDRDQVAKPKRGRPKKSTAANRVKTVTITITLAEDVYKEVMQLCEERNLTFDAYAQVILRGARKNPLLFKLDSRMTFGKYKGERVEDVIKADPAYIMWASSKVESFTLDEEASAFLVGHEDEDADEDTTTAVMYDPLD